jgi:uncharacterized membrane protein HdeD (DUF308 family)
MRILGALFTVIGTLLLMMGVVYTLYGFTSVSGVESWYNGFAGFMMIGIAVLMYIFAVLCQIARTLKVSTIRP